MTASIRLIGGLLKVARHNECVELFNVKRVYVIGHPGKCVRSRYEMAVARCCAQCYDVGAHTSHVLHGVRAVSSPYLRSRPYSCVRVMPSLRAAFDLFHAVS